MSDQAIPRHHLRVAANEFVTIVWITLQEGKELLKADFLPVSIVLNGHEFFSPQAKQLLFMQFHYTISRLPDARLHDLRYSVATFLLSMGVHPKIVQDILGHSEISMTLDTYSHVSPTMQREAMDKLNEMFGEWSKLDYQGTDVM